MSVGRVKVYGERNTGTNYLTKLLRRNFSVVLLRGIYPTRLRRWTRDHEGVRNLYFRWTERRNLGWKHRRAPSAETLARWGTDAEDLLFLTITKNPYSWLLSLHRNPYHRRRGAEELETFLRTPWRTQGRDAAARTYANPVELWNDKNASYLRLASHARCANLRYEDLVLDPVAVLQDLASRYDLAPVGPEILNVRESTKDPEKDFAYYRRYYRDELWRDRLDAASIELVNRHLDRDVTRAFAYAIL